MLAHLASISIITLARALTGVRAIWRGGAPKADADGLFRQPPQPWRFVLLWASLPPDLRSLTGRCRLRTAGSRRQAAPLHRLRSVQRADDPQGRRRRRAANPVEQMTEALAAGDSLIMFPEGTRNTGDDILLPLKSGLYHLARACPQVRLVPVWIENLKRVLPKGTLVPIPAGLLGWSVRRAPIVLGEGEDKASIHRNARGRPCWICALNINSEEGAGMNDRRFDRRDHVVAVWRRRRRARLRLGHRRACSSGAWRTGGSRIR